MSFIRYLLISVVLVHLFSMPDVVRAEGEVNDLKPEQKFDLAMEYVYCRNVPRSEDAVSEWKLQYKDVVDQEYIEGMKPIFDRCNGITDQMVRSIPDLLESAANADFIDAKIAYYTYGRPDQRFYSAKEYEIAFNNFQSKSYAFIISALEQGSNEALYLTGYAYLEGRGVDADPEKSLSYFKAFELCTGTPVVNEMNLLTSHYDFDPSAIDSSHKSQALAETHCQINRQEQK